MNVRGVQLLEHVLNIVGRHNILRQFTIQIVVRKKFLVAAQLEQPIHHIVSIFFFNSHLLLSSINIATETRSHREISKQKSRLIILNFSVSRCLRGNTVNVPFYSSAPRAKSSRAVSLIPIAEAKACRAVQARPP